MADRSDLRFDRMIRTEWIDMGQIHGVRILVAGAGALGNEVVKDLVLAGFRDITVADFDTVEESNLSRCVLFRQRFIGRNKAEVVAEMASDLDPDCSVKAVPARVQDLPELDFDVMVGCLDNISARLHLNSHAKYLGIPYVDGSTDGFRGKVQVVLDGPCMECMMNRTHLNELHRTFSCDAENGVVRDDGPVLSSGITTSSAIAAMCVREVMKIVCGRKDLCIRGVSFYDGIAGTTELLSLERNPKCPNHEGEKCR